MKYSMTEPCDQCPFLKGSGFTWNSLVAHASGEFACHKTCKVEELVVSDDAFDENAASWWRLTSTRRCNECRREHLCRLIQKGKLDEK